MLSAPVHIYSCPHMCSVRPAALKTSRISSGRDGSLPSWMLRRERVPGAHSAPGLRAPCTQCIPWLVREPFSWMRTTPPQAPHVINYIATAWALTLWTVEVLESTSCSVDAAVRAVIAGSDRHAESLIKNYTRDLSVQLNE